LAALPRKALRSYDYSDDAFVNKMERSAWAAPFLSAFVQARQANAPGQKYKNLRGLSMRQIALFAVLASLLPVTAAYAQTMPVSQFLAKAEALQKKGAMALFSSDIGLLKKELQNSGKQLKVERDAAKKAGRQPDTCPPEKASVNSNEVLAHFNSIPPQQRNMPVKAALAGLMRKKYPC
jgi:hypothetical protein